MNYEAVIGLEIHLQLKLRTKMFSPSENAREDNGQNRSICAIDLGHPGTLPLVNEKAVETAAKLGFALGMDVQAYSKFDRKHYFYPDLPKGYQITQYDRPICLDGALAVTVNGEEKSFRFERMHLEEDAAKSFHVQAGDGDATAVDYNRAGCALCEIVTRPDFHAPAEARAFLEELKRYARYAGASDADMEKGNLRVDANVSLRPVGDEKLYPKTEIKNLNSFRGVERAIAYEIVEQEKLWEAGQAPNVTRTVGWRDDEGKTVLQRTKEGATDYRYFPEPDVSPIVITDAQMDEWRSSLPEMPGPKRKRFVEEYALKPLAAGQLVDDKALADYFEELASETMENLDEVEDNDEKRHAVAKLAYGWLTSELLKLLNAKGLELADCPVKPERFADLLAMLFRRQINSSNAQRALGIMFDANKSLDTVLAEENLAINADAVDLDAVIAGIINENPKEAEAYRAGKTVLLQFFVGLGMKKTKGAVDPETLKEKIEKALG